MHDAQSPTCVCATWLHHCVATPAPSPSHPSAPTSRRGHRERLRPPMGMRLISSSREPSWVQGEGQV